MGLLDFAGFDEDLPRFLSVLVLLFVGVLGFASFIYFYGCFFIWLC